ncbi:Flp family type IVb pilin [Variovorax boronicumulans]|uniref:Flp family type IVb pilin n=1 Tax=Variovorax boronicumulans TaxID=436515 RepID=UPI0027817FD7|nr:pilus assembly protein [Variovorax boronicumulans]MDQ0043668.1 Flp pilus assembly pilin Flp [Variovorax boronicumulans]
MQANRLTAMSRRIAAKIKIRGQGMTEYLVILGLIAIAAIAVFSFFGQTMRNQVAGMAQEVGGKTGAAEVTNAQAAAAKASTNAEVNMNMSTYTKGGADGAK